jgi:hypothetical protein
MGVGVLYSGPTRFTPSSPTAFPFVFLLMPSLNFKKSVSNLKERLSSRSKGNGQITTPTQTESNENQPEKPSDKTYHHHHHHRPHMPHFHHHKPELSNEPIGPFLKYSGISGAMWQGSVLLVLPTAGIIFSNHKNLSLRYLSGIKLLQLWFPDSLQNQFISTKPIRSGNLRYMFHKQTLEILDSSIQ